MLFRLIIQSWRHNLRRKTLAIATVFLAAALISALLAVSINSGDKMSREMKSYGANILVEPATQAVLPELLGDAAHAPRNTSDYIDESELLNIKEIFWRNNILGFAPLLPGEARIITPPSPDSGLPPPASGDHSDKVVPVLGTFFDKALPLPDEPAFRTGQSDIALYWNVRGEWPEDDAPQALAGSRLAAAHGWTPGTRVTLASVAEATNAPLQTANASQAPAPPVTVIVTGILESGGPEEDQLLLPLARAQQLLGLSGKVQSVRVSAMTVPENRLSTRARVDPDSLAAEDYDRWYCTAYVSSIAHQLEETLSGVVARPIWQVAASEGQIITKIQLLLIIATLAALLAAAMGIASLMTTTIMERSREIGLMKALAARPWQIMTLFYAEAALSGLLGGAAGCLAGWGLARLIGWTLFGAPLEFAWIVVPVVLLISLLISLIGTWFPAHQITKLYPAEVLYGRK
ncbi:ABC transporter permease [Opitutaceae bacterium TAV5]|nr:ABC transporter permease [Opitutaceae bacterium TAV5]